MAFDLYDLSANVSINMADIEVGLVDVCEKFGIKALNDYQREAITQFVYKKTDLLLNLPTGYGKSLVYQALLYLWFSIPFIELLIT